MRSLLLDLETSYVYFVCLNRLLQQIHQAMRRLRLWQLKTAPSRRKVGSPCGTKKVEGYIGKNLMVVRSGTRVRVEDDNN